MVSKFSNEEMENILQVQSMEENIRMDESAEQNEIMKDIRQTVKIHKNNSQEYEKAIRYIYGLMKDGALQIGSKLPTERAIAETVGIGRNSTREAMSILHGMGLVERVQGSGNYISKNVGHSIWQTIKMMMALGSVTKNDVCEFRRAMEKAVCNTLIEGDLSRLNTQKITQLLEEMAKLQGTHSAAIDKAFHDELIFATGNNLWMIIMEAVTDMYTEWIDYVIQRVDVDKRYKLVQYHKNIYTCLMQKDKTGMLQAIDAHYDIIEDMLQV